MCWCWVPYNHYTRYAVAHIDFIYNCVNCNSFKLQTYSVVSRATHRRLAQTEMAIQNIAIDFRHITVVYAYVLTWIKVKTFSNWNSQRNGIKWKQHNRVQFACSIYWMLSYLPLYLPVRCNEIIFVCISQTCVNQIQQTHTHTQRLRPTTAFECVAAQWHRHELQATGVQLYIRERKIVKILIMLTRNEEKRRMHHYGKLVRHCQRR